MLTRTRKKARSFIDPFSAPEIRRLVAEFGSPLLIVDCQRVREQYRKLHKALPGVDLHYALKPLPHPAVVETIVELGGWLDLATTGEAQLVTQLGVDPARCIHTHPIKRDIDVRNALHLGVKVFVADNPDEVRKFEAYRDKAELLLRVSFRSPGAVVDLSRKFGCDPEDLIELAWSRGARPAVLDRLRQLPARPYRSVADLTSGLQDLPSTVDPWESTAR